MQWGIFGFVRFGYTSGLFSDESAAVHLALHGNLVEGGQELGSSAVSLHAYATRNAVSNWKSCAYFESFATSRKKAD